MLQCRNLLFTIVICGAVGCSRESTSVTPQETSSSAPIEHSHSVSTDVAVVTHEAAHSRTEFKDLIVVDAEGNPVAQATILGTAASMGGPSFFTDTDGQANIPFAIQPIQWVTVSKEGFKTASMIDINQPRPIRIMLEQGEGIVRPTSVMGIGDASLNSSGEPGT